MTQSGNDRPLGPGALKLVAAAWVLALVCVATYQAVKADPNAGLLLMAAALLAGVGLLRVLVAVLQRLAAPADPAGDHPAPGHAQGLHLAAPSGNGSAQDPAG